MKENQTNESWDFLKDNLTVEEKNTIAENCSCSVNTVYNYIGGKRSNIHLANAIYKSAIYILESRGVYLEDVL